MREDTLLVILTDGETSMLSVTDYMTCQKEYDINQKHMDTGHFWDFFSEHFKDDFLGKHACAIDKKSPGYSMLLNEQRDWRRTKELKRLNDRAWRDAFNKKRRKRYWA